jgi:uncharacterized protein YggU (UPF0235/DUF167 family)
VTGPVAPAPGGARIAIRLTPKARRAGIDGVKPGADGQVELAVSVTEAPEDGRAKAALLRLLAKAWHCPASDLTLVRGAASRHKVVQRRGDGDLAARLEAWVNEVVDGRTGD